LTADVLSSYSRDFDTIFFSKLDIDDVPSVPARQHITALPAFITYKDGEILSVSAMTTLKVLKLMLEELKDI
jgi:thioredoxin-like negative regulator of GroEL